MILRLVSQILLFFFFLMIRRPPRPPLFPSPPLFRSVAGIGIRRLACDIARHSQEVRNRLHVTVCGKAPHRQQATGDRKSTRLNSSHGYISYAVFCLKKKNRNGALLTVCSADARDCSA